jgi:preprotein translocase subunit YajC
MPPTDELLLWAAVLLVPLLALWAFFWVRRMRHRRKWRSKRPINVRVGRNE